MDTDHIDDLLRPTNSCLRDGHEGRFAAHFARVRRDEQALRHFARNHKRGWSKSAQAKLDAERRAAALDELAREAFGVGCREVGERELAEAVARTLEAVFGG